MGTGSNMTELTIDVKLLDLNKVKSKTEDKSKLKGSFMATLAEDVRGGGMKRGLFGTDSDQNGMLEEIPRSGI